MMELNIALGSATNAPLRLNNEKAGKKGSWKKRHREKSLQKAKERRLENRKQHQSEAKDAQADEFSSGIDSSQKSKPTGVDVANEVKEISRHAKKPRITTSNNSTRNLTVEGARGQTKRESPTKPAVRKRQRATSPSRKTETVRDDQNPEAVRAALAVIGTDVTKVTDGSSGQQLSDKKGEESNISDPEKDESRKDETFGTSSFEDVGLYRSIVHHLAQRMGVEVPTKVQQELLKTVLNLHEGQRTIDVLVRSPTGSGKTLAYLLPLAHYLLNRTRRVVRKDGALAVIVVPTRELADQVEEVAKQLFQPWHWIVIGSVVGGESKRREKARLRKGVNVLVGTPGRLLDHMRNTQSFLYGFCEFLVLDEADRLLDLGFEEEVQEVVRNLDRQARISNPGAGKLRSNILLSATLRADVQQLAKYSLQDPVTVTVNTTERGSGKNFSMPQHLKQHFCIVDQKYRLVTLACFLRLRALKGSEEFDGRQNDSFLPPCKIIVFFSTCDSVDFHYEMLKGTKVPPVLRGRTHSSSPPLSLLPLTIFRLHGNHTQADRTESLRGFRRSHRAVLLCTDVAARGLDLKGLTFSIQYDPPTGGKGEELEYLHRAGRTARIGAGGDALLFLLPSERAYIGKLESKGISISEISGSAALAALNPGVDLSSQDSISYSTRLVTSALQEAFENRVKDSGTMKHLALSAFQSYCRAYATHAKEVRYFFHVRNLHLGHVARAFSLSDKPAEFNEMMTEIKKAKDEVEIAERKEKGFKETAGKQKRLIARAIAEGEAQPFNDQSTDLARRRREKGRGQEAFRELAMEFGS